MEINKCNKLFLINGASFQTCTGFSSLPNLNNKLLIRMRQKMAIELGIKPKPQVLLTYWSLST